MRTLTARSALLIATCLTVAGALFMLTPKRHFTATGWVTRVLTSLFGDHGPAYAMFLGAFALCVFALVRWLSGPGQPRSRRARPLS